MSRHDQTATLWAHQSSGGRQRLYEGLCPQLGPLGCRAAVRLDQVGSARRVEYTAIGDTTNTAARLEGMTKGSGYQLFVSGTCRDLLVDTSGLDFVQSLEVRGRTEPVNVWADEGTKPPLARNNS